jgi:hypothetical protein
MMLFLVMTSDESITIGGVGVKTTLVEGTVGAGISLTSLRLVSSAIDFLLRSLHLPPSFICGDCQRG